MPHEIATEVIGNIIEAAVEVVSGLGSEPKPRRRSWQSYLSIAVLVIAALLLAAWWLGLFAG
ncbi:hypothetical protein [Novosphingobium sp. P6W]|uniref:hypothetical protein n=1 Tax=Novosphingobium sp. P6W TaxID=1609758 RepID=UPI0005C2D572|nr:hypothetical protein [Novosphingobium sp. P6W]AXB75613.1 hypothetical protein TQ38_003030 [Novosphingobium sp. P6W]KIS29686.1 hypothetical protein TQ38_26630 [Novosphingobium sp. P6W]